MHNSPPPAAVLAVDLGTGSARALLVDARLAILHQHAVPLPLSEPHPGWAEQDAHQVSAAAFQAIGACVAWARSAGVDVLGISFSNAVSSLLPLDEALQPISPALIWADQRAHRQAQAIKDQAGAELYRRTGCPVHASYWLPKLLWLKEHQAERYARARHWVTLKDYVVLQLSGELAGDVSNAAATGLLDLQRRTWDEAAFDLAGLRREQLLPLYATTDRLPRLSTEAVQSLGLPEKTPLVLGAGDGVMSSLGSGAVSPGQATTMIGSSCACRTVTGRPVSSDSLQRTWCYPLADGLWVLGGAGNSGGLVADWFAGLLAETSNPSSKDAALAQLFRLAAQVPAAAEGLLFLPYLWGERAPLWDSAARGAFIGLNSYHARPHLARAVLEGTVYALYSIFQALEFTLQPEAISQVRASGGYTRSPEWLQIQADMFAMPISIPAAHEGSALGAAILGLYALGVLDSLQAGADLVAIRETIQPNQANAATYRRFLPLYEAAYRGLKPVFDQLQDFTRS